MAPTRWWFRDKPDDETSTRVATQDAAIVQLARSASLASGSLEDALLEVATVAARLLGVARVTVWRFDENRSRLHCVYLHGSAASTLDTEDLTAERYPRYFAALDEERVLDADFAASDARTAELAESYLWPLGITSMLDAPIRAAGTMVGVVCHEHVGAPRVWMDDEKRFAGAIGDLLAVGIESAERRRAEKAREEEARVTSAVAELGQELIAGFTDDSTSLMDRLCQTAARLMECDAVHVLRRDEARGGYCLVASAGVPPEERAVSEALFIPDAFVTTEQLEVDGVAMDYFSNSGQSALDTLSARFAAQILVATVPIRRGSSIVGLLHFQRRNTHASQPFDSTDKGIAKGIGRIASMALETKRLIDELRSARRVKSDFLAMMSHELRTPLNAISGYAELLLDGAMGELNREQHEAIGVIRESAAKQCHMVQGVLSVEKLERGDLHLQIADTSPRTLIDEVVKEAPRSENVSLAVNVAENLRALSTDAGKLKAALREIVDNAVKFTQSGSVSIAAYDTAEGMVFSVADTGIGIPPEARSEIFAAFHQLQQSPTRRFEGIGIGLYLARELVGHLGGRIDVQSEVGRGSVFRIVVPSQGDFARPEMGLVSSGGAPREPMAASFGSASPGIGDKRVAERPT